METKPKSKRKVPPGSPIFPDTPRLSKEEIARRKAEDEIFAQRCRAIFDKVAPHTWLIIMIGQLLLSQIVATILLILIQKWLFKKLRSNIQLPCY